MPNLVAEFLSNSLDRYEAIQAEIDQRLENSRMRAYNILQQSYEGEFPEYERDFSEPAQETPESSDSSRSDNDSRQPRALEN